MHQHLQQPGGQYEPTYFTTVQRYQLQYHPKSGTEINYDRLPTHEDLQGMELAYREQQYTDFAIDHFMQTKLLAYVGGTLSAVLALVVIGSVIPLSYAFSAAGGVTCLANLFFAYKRRVSVLRVIKAILLPLIAVMLAVCFSVLLSSRTVATLAIAGIALYLVRRFGSEVFGFYRDWLYTHPRLRPATRASPAPIRMGASLPFLAGVFVLAALGPWLSITVTIVAIAGWSLWRCRRGGSIWRLIITARMPMAQYLTYGSTSTGAPGVWLPKETPVQRRTHLLVVLGAVYLTLVVGLSVCFPWDLILLPLYQLRHSQPPKGWDDPELWTFHRYLADSPHGWLALTVWNVFSNHGFALCYVVAVAISAVLPNLVLVAAYRDAILDAERLRREVDGEDKGLLIDGDSDRSEWQWYVDRLRSSPHVAPDPMGRVVRERDHLFLGVEPKAQFPILLERSILSEHAYIVGQSGAGKTSLAIMPLVLQLLRGSGAGGPADKKNPNDASELPPPLVVLDLKGDPALFFTIQAEALAWRKAHGIDDSTREGRANPLGAFRFFTPEAGKASHYFNPFLSLKGPARTPIQVCQLLLESLSLNHGEGYGRSYYSRRSRMLLFQALGHASNPSSFDQLFAVLKTDEFRKEGNESLELLSVIEALTQYPQLSATRNLARPEQAIHMPSVLEHRQVVYFWLPAAVESVSVREIGKLALFGLLSSAIERQRAGKEHRQAYLVIDEFQRLAGDNFRIVLEQARSFGIGAILANQTQSDLKTQDMDLRPTVNTNTRFKQFFSVSDPTELSDLVLLSGQELSVNKGWSVNSGTSSSGHSSSSSGFSWSETVKPRLTVNDLLRISDHPLDSVVLVSRGAGYTQYGGAPIPVRSTWPISEELYRQRQTQPWPERDDYEDDTVVVASKAPTAVDQERDRKLSVEIAAKLEAFAQTKKPRMRRERPAGTEGASTESTGGVEPRPPETETQGHA